ncbi:unnamed protein product [marine sediment metagenome]|uniref:Peptidase M15A C-terminal domain-containing protein n=1 Tax=marine sediment metagenome TaxID=412755 RepID=X1SEZ8_9ZZZZ
MKDINNIRIDTNFILSEFQCPCCGRVMIHPDLLKRLAKLRLRIQEPIYINSGYRCKAENKHVGGTKASYHTFGMAADIEVKNTDLLNLAQLAESVGFNGIGIYGNFLHLDVRPKKYHWSGLS